MWKNSRIESIADRFYLDILSGKADERYNLEKAPNKIKRRQVLRDISHLFSVFPDANYCEVFDGYMRSFEKYQREFDSKGYKFPWCKLRLENPSKKGEKGFLRRN